MAETWTGLDAGYPPSSFDLLATLLTKNFCLTVEITDSQGGLFRGDLRQLIKCCLRLQDFLRVALRQQILPWLRQKKQATGRM